jgi:hypothetical protein
MGHSADVSSGCDHEAILAAFTSRRSASRAQAVRAAYLDVHADQLLSRMLDDSDDLSFDSVAIAAHLGDLTGARGDAALRRAIRVSGPGSRDLRCASLLALAKRLGPSATPDLLVGLTASDAAVKDYSVIGLAGAGDDRAWAPVLEYLRAVLRRKRRAQGQSEVSMAVAYLAQHASDPSRRSELVAFIRRHWDAIDEVEWFARLWPAAAPYGPNLEAVPAPDSAALRTWARSPLFTPLGVPEV